MIIYLKFFFLLPVFILLFLINYIDFRGFEISELVSICHNVAVQLLPFEFYI